MHFEIDEEEGKAPLADVESNHFLDLLSERKSEYDLDEEEESKNGKMNMDVFSDNRLDTMDKLDV
jgi:hypothetical protein